MPESSRPRVLIADDHNLVAEALKQILAPEFDVIGMVFDGRNLIATAHKLRPDVILADVAMPLLNGLDAAGRIKRMLPDTKIVYVTMNRDPDLVVEALRRGASGYLLKTAAVNELPAAIHAALRGEVWISSSLNGSVYSPLPQAEKFSPARDLLTDRQLDVLQLLAEGRTLKEVAGILNVSARTVAFHKYRMMESLGLQNDMEVVQRAIRDHIVF
jgi:DNA-binding NarL/FixJ family response regulator